MKTKFNSKIILIGCLAALTFAMCSSPALAQDPTPTPATTWINTALTGGDWFDCNNNWDNGCPNSSTDAYINNGGTAKINGPNASAHSLTLGFNHGDSGTVVVDGQNGGTLVIADPDDNVGPINIRVGGVGTLIVKNGGSVVTGYASLGQLANQFWKSSGTAKVDGAGSSWNVKGGPGGPISATLVVGGIDYPYFAAGLLSVTDGGSVTVWLPPNSGYYNTVVQEAGTVTGNGAITMIGSAHGTDILGTLAPSGTLTINGNPILILDSDSTMLSSVTPEAGAANVDVASGTATLAEGSHLVVTMKGDFTHGPTRFTLLHAQDGLFGTFTTESINYPPDQGWHPKIAYDGNYVYLDLVFDLN